MALRFLDGFDHYATADVAKKWTAVTGSATVSATNGRRSTASLRGATNSYVTLTLDNQATWIVGCALRVAAVATTGDVPFLAVRDGATTQLDVVVNLTTNTLSVRRGGSTTLGTTTYVVPLSTYLYLELAVTLHSTAGAVTLRVNGATVLALTSVNTQQTANAYAQTLRVGNTGTVATVGNLDFDDLYVCDGSGSAPHNTFLGDCRVDTLFPTSDGTSQQWTPSTPGTHYTLVDEAAPNTTDFVSSSTVGHRDTYGMQDLTAMTGTIYGVQLNLAALKSDAGSRSVKPLLVSGASEALGAATALGTSQTYTRHVQTTDPATGAAWAESAINAMQTGAEAA